MKSITDPGNRSTAFDYDARGRRTEVDAPDTFDADGNNLVNITTTHYFPDGSVKEITGGQTYRVTHTYDYADRQKTMTTYGTETATTTWIYSPDRGFLVEKNYPGETDDGVTDRDYTHTAAGRLFTRTWERGVLTTYGYDDGGRLETVTYSNETNGHTTPDLAITSDALGRKTLEIQENRSRIDYTYNPATLAPDTETIAYDLNGDGTLDFTRVLDRAQDPLNRDEGWQLKNSTTVENEVEYGYDIAGRLSTVADAANTFTYGYQYDQTAATDPRVGSTTGTKQDYMPYTLTKSGSPTLQTLRTYEARRDALTTIQNKAGSVPRSSYTYAVNPFGQRTDLTTAFDLGVGVSANPGDTDWGYDSLGQLKTAAAPGTAADRYFAYDAIGNRLESRAGTATNSGGTLTEYFGKLTPSPVAGANSINQYVGIKKGAATIEPGYDDDGNATAYPVKALGSSSLASCVLTWDAENRLISTSVNSITTTHLYDAQSRKFATTTGSTTTTLYIYDGWNCIAEYEGGTGVSPVLNKTRLWGLDLSGTLQGAGGVGGLLSETINNQPSTLNFFPTYDGNGNISEYLAADGTTTAHFEYDAFGNTVIDTDTTNQFAYRFSTKPLDFTTGLYYYGYRFYDPQTGRWPSRDPIGERGGKNLYGMMRNNVVKGWEFLGLYPSIFESSDQPKGGQVSNSCWWCKCYFTFKFNIPGGENFNNEVDELFKDFDGSLFDPRGDDWNFDGNRVPRIVTPERLAEAQAAYRNYLTEYLTSRNNALSRLNGLSYDGIGQTNQEDIAQWKAMEDLKNKLRSAWGELEDDSEKYLEKPVKFPDCDCRQGGPPEDRPPGGLS